jgi:hypothetical protein
LYNIPEAIKAWQKALDTLPNDNLTPSELKQREQYEAGLTASKRKTDENILARVITIPATSGQHPWQVAKAMEPELQRRGIELATSSVRSLAVTGAEFPSCFFNRRGSS